MTKQEKLTKEAEARREHRVWLDDYGRWRAEHREALAMLAKVQEMILEREAAMEGQAAEVQAHELELQKYDLIGIESFTPDPEKQIAENAKFTQKHRCARDAYERTKKQHINVVEEIEKLFKVCQL